jgi:hypothetical protein
MTTASDRADELALQDRVIAEVARANAEELPLLGGTATTDAAPAERSEPVVKTSELAPKRGK